MNAQGSTAASANTTRARDETLANVLNRKSLHAHLHLPAPYFRIVYAVRRFRRVRPPKPSQVTFAAASENDSELRTRQTIDGIESA